MEYKICCGGLHYRTPYLVFGALRLGFRSSTTEIYVTIRFGIFVMENYTWPIQMTDPEGMGGYTPSTWK